MKNTDEVLFSAGETFEYARQYLKQQGAYIRMEAAERVSRTASAIVTVIVLGFFAALILIMLSIAAGFWLAAATGSYVEAFLMISAAYALMGTLMFLFRRLLITQPTLNIVLNAFFERENTARKKQ